MRLGKKVSTDPFINFLREKIFIRENGTWFTFCKQMVSKEGPVSPVDVSSQ